MIPDSMFTDGASALLPALYRIALSVLRHPQDAQDAVQQGMLNAWAARGRADPRNLRAWLTRIVINECRNIQRHRMRVLPTDALEETGYTPPDRQLADAVRALPEPLRVPLLLKYMEGYSEKEIAYTLHAPVSTVKSRLYRARRALQKTLSDEEVSFE